MKKYFCILLLICSLFCFVYINFAFSDIKTVKYSKMMTTEYSELLNVSGEFESLDKTYIQLSYPVYVKDVYVTTNTYVNKGQALFSLDKEKMISVLSGNQQENLLENISYDDISTLSSINKIDASAVYNMPDTIYASSDGIITRLNVYPGAIVMSNQHLAVLTHSDNIVAKFTLSQIDYGKISVGDSVDITPVAFQNSSYNGIISRQNAVVKTQNTAVGSKVVVDVFANITNPDNKVADGLQVNGTIQRGQPVTINSLDYSFINQDSDGQYVYIYSKGRAEKFYIETGIEAEDYTEIRTEFEKDTIFVTAENLKDGDRIILEN